jgi:hypothetical protein
MARQYIVLMTISPDQGQLIYPAPEGEPPVIVDEAVLFAASSEHFTVEERAKLLMDKGVIVPADAPDQSRDRPLETETNRG